MSNPDANKGKYQWRPPQYKPIAIVHMNAHGKNVPKSAVPKQEEIVEVAPNADSVMQPNEENAQISQDNAQLLPLSTEANACGNKLVEDKQPLIKASDLRISKPVKPSPEQNEEEIKDIKVKIASLFKDLKAEQQITISWQQKCLFIMQQLQDSMRVEGNLAELRKKFVWPVSDPKELKAECTLGHERLKLDLSIPLLPLQVEQTKLQEVIKFVKEVPVSEEQMKELKLIESKIADSALGNAILLKEFEALNTNFLDLINAIQCAKVKAKNIARLLSAHELTEFHLGQCDVNFELLETNFIEICTSIKVDFEKEANDHSKFVDLKPKWTAHCLAQVRENKKRSAMKVVLEQREAKLCEQYAQLDKMFKSIEKSQYDVRLELLLLLNQKVNMESESYQLAAQVKIDLEAVQREIFNRMRKENTKCLRSSKLAKKKQEMKEWRLRMDKIHNAQLRIRLSAKKANTNELEDQIKTQKLIIEQIHSDAEKTENEHHVVVGRFLDTITKLMEDKQSLRNRLQLVKEFAYQLRADSSIAKSDAEKSKEQRRVAEEDNLNVMTLLKVAKNNGYTLGDTLCLATLKVVRLQHRLWLSEEANLRLEISSRENESKAEQMIRNVEKEKAKIEKDFQNLLSMSERTIGGLQTRIKMAESQLYNKQSTIKRLKASLSEANRRYLSSVTQPEKSTIARRWSATNMLALKHGVKQTSNMHRKIKTLHETLKAKNVKMKIERVLWERKMYILLKDKFESNLQFFKPKEIVERLQVEMQTKVKDLYALKAIRSAGDCKANMEYLCLRQERKTRHFTEQDIRRQPFYVKELLEAACMTDPISSVNNLEQTDHQVQDVQEVEYDNGDPVVNDEPDRPLYDSQDIGCMTDPVEIKSSKRYEFLAPRDDMQAAACSSYAGNDHSVKKLTATKMTEFSSDPFRKWLESCGERAREMQAKEILDLKNMNAALIAETHAQDIMILKYQTQIQEELQAKPVASVSNVASQTDTNSDKIIWELSEKLNCALQLNRSRYERIKVLEKEIIQLEHGAGYILDVSPHVMEQMTDLKAEMRQIKQENAELNLKYTFAKNALEVRWGDLREVRQAIDTSPHGMD